MDYQSYCDKISEKFLKSEYISIAKNSYKMLFSPKKAISGARVYAFLINSQKPSAKLSKALCQYAVSAAYYDEKDTHLKTVVIPIFIGESASFEVKAFKEDGAYVLPCAVNLDSGSFKTAEKFPILSGGQFKAICDFAKSVLHP